MKGVKKTAKNIKKLKIQGAAHIAEAAFKALSKLAKNSKAKNTKAYFKELEKAKKILIKSRPTEPAMRNSLNYLMNNLKDYDDLKEIKKTARKIYRPFLKELKHERKDLAIYGSKMIESKFKVFTHCHSSTVINLLKQARKRRSFEVFNTETRPLYQGRKTSKELALANIKVTHFVDNAASQFIKDCDILLLGADAVFADGRVVNKVGSLILTQLAHQYDIPVYICTTTWKFSPESILGKKETIEERDPKEVWHKIPKHITVRNPAFDLIPPDHITGVICEFGVFTVDNFIRLVKEKRPYLI